MLTHQGAFNEVVDDDNDDNDDDDDLVFSQLAFYANLHRAVSYPDGPMTPDIDLRRMLTGLHPFQHLLSHTEIMEG